MKHEALIKEYLKHKLATDAKWAQRGLLRIYEFQTLDEQTKDETGEKNNVGFTGTDGFILSRFAKGLKQYGSLTNKQMVYVYRKMPKYWKQLWNLISEDKQQELLNTKIIIK